MEHVNTVAETLEDKLTHDLGYDDHFHEHHEGDKFQSNFLKKMIVLNHILVIGQKIGLRKPKYYMTMLLTII